MCGKRRPKRSSYWQSSQATRGTMWVVNATEGTEKTRKRMEKGLSKPTGLAQPFLVFNPFSVFSVPSVPLCLLPVRWLGGDPLDPFFRLFRHPGHAGVADGVTEHLRLLDAVEPQLHLALGHDLQRAGVEEDAV